MVFAVSSALATSSPAGMSAAITTVAASLSLPRGVAEMPLLFGDLTYHNQLWYSLPELFRFFVSGNLGNICFFLIERGLYTVIEAIPSPPTFLIEHHDSASFIVGYILQIVTQHLLHAWLVYGLNTINSRDKYLRTLGGQASAYVIALIGSTVLNVFLRRRGMSKNTAFVTTLYLFACINYFVIGWITRRSGTDAVPEQSSLNVGIVTEATCSSSFSLVLGREKAIRRGGACDTARQATSFRQNTGADGTWPVRTMITENQPGRCLDSDLLFSHQMSSTLKKFR
jgi:hypothetical protein